MSGLDLDQLQTFIDVVESGSFSAAARRRGLSQPAVSLRIRQLELYMGVSLIDRHNSRIRISPAGNVLYLEALKINNAVGAASASLEQFRTQADGQVRIGAGPSVSMYLLPPVLASLKLDHPGVEIAIRGGNVADIMAWLDDDQVDIAVVSRPTITASMAARHLMDDELVLIRHRDEPMSYRNYSPAVLSSMSLIMLPPGGGTRPIIDGWFHSAGLACKPMLELTSVEAVKHMVEARFGCAIIPKLAVDPPGKRGNIVHESLTPRLFRPLEMIVRQDKKLTRQFREVLHAFDRLPQLSAHLDDTP